MTTDFHVSKADGYSFSLEVGFKTDDDRKDMRRVQKLMGDGGYDPKTKKNINNGLPIPLRLTISRLEPSGESPFYDKEFFELELFGIAARHFSKMIDGVKLLPGNYRVRVEALRDIPELADTPMKFVIWIKIP